MLHSLWRTLLFLFLLTSVITAYEDDVSIEIEGMSNFFNPFNWFGEDKTASEAPERDNIPLIDLDPEPKSALEANAAEPNLASPSESLSEREVPQANSGSEVRVEGAPQESPVSRTPINLNRGMQPVLKNTANNFGGFPRNPNNYGSPGGGQPFGSHPNASPYGNSPYGRPPYGNSPYSPHNPSFGNPPYGGSNSYHNVPRPRNPQANRNYPAASPNRPLYKSKSNKKRAKTTSKPNEHPAQ